MILKGKNLYLTGMMGSGKTTVGRILSRWLGVEFIDMDEELERRVGKSVKEIFVQYGEPYFRELEENLVKELTSTSGRVIATGGGTLLNPENREALDGSGFLVYLHVPVKTLAERMRTVINRPLLQEAPPSKSLHLLWKQRKHIYESIPCKVSATSDPEHVAQLILFSLPPVYEILWKGRENVFLGYNLLPLLREHLSVEKFTEKIFVVTHRKIYDRYKAILTHRSSDKELIPIFLPEGEKTKDFRYAREIFKHLMRNHADRKTPVVVVGGGVLGDVAGFAAATFMRGLPLFQLPTTFLAQIDSSLGGKNGVNMNGIKNLVGTFYFPRGTYIDLLFLLSLPSKELSAGMAEAVKAGIIGDPGLIEYAEEHCDEILQKKLPALYEVVRRSALVKLHIVENDPFEMGQRRWLNLGHTIAHGIEAATAFNRVSHGEAVSLGLILESRLAEALGIADKGLSQKVVNIMSRFQLPIQLDQINLEKVKQRMRMDKKRQGGKTVFILPKKIGEVQEVLIENLDEVFKQIGWVKN